MAFLKSGNKWSAALLGMLIVVLITAAFLPILPQSKCGGRISYATLLKQEWRKRQHKQTDAAKNAESQGKATECPDKNT